MKRNQLVVLAVIAIVLGGLAYFSSTKGRPRPDSSAALLGKPVLEALQVAETLNSIASIVFSSPGATITVARVEGTWVAPERFNHPVDFGRVRDFLWKLRELKIGPVLSAGSAQLADLALLPPGRGEPGSGGTSIDLRDAEGKTIAALVAGKEHMRQMPDDGMQSPYGMQGGYPDGRYVSAAGRVCLVADALTEIPSAPRDWMDTQLANVPAADTQEIMITEGDRVLTFQRPDGGNLALPDLADNEEMDSYKVNDLAGMLSYLAFDDVADPARPDAELGFDEPIVYSARNKKNQVFTLTVGGAVEGSDGRYVRLNASFMPPKGDAEAASARETAATATNAVSAAETDTAAAQQAEEARQKKAEEQKEIAGEVKQFNEKVRGWTYRVAAHTVTHLAADRSAFIKEKKTEKASEEPKQE